nr:ribonuclease H-like domain-containing protein [Tanacetum cinerariifolium]
MFIQPHDLDFVPEPIYPEYIPLEDEHILLAQEQPLPPVVSPTAESPKYVVESDPEEDPEEYKDDATEDGQVDYPMDGGDNDDGDSSGDDADNEDEDDEEEHIAPADSTIVIPTDELASTQALIDAVTAALPSPPPLHMPPSVDCRDDIHETEMPPCKRLCLSTLGSRYEVGESSAARPTGGRWIDYGFVSTLDAEARRQGIREVGYILASFSMKSISLIGVKIADLGNPQQALKDKGISDSGCSRHMTWNMSYLSEFEELNGGYVAFGDADLTWWNSQIRSLGSDAYSMTWEFAADETEKIDKYVSGLPNNIYGSVKASKPKTLDETIEHRPLRLVSPDDNEFHSHNH